VNLVGLSGAQALATWVIAAAVVSGLYLLRPRRLPRKVAYLALWEQLLSSARTSQLFGRLRRVGSWLLALLLVALLTAALADPRPAAAERTLHVVLLDAGLGMQATDLAPSRFERLRARAHELVDRLPEGDVGLVVAAGGTPTAGHISGDPAALHAEIDRLSPSDAEADLAEALALALDAAHDERRVRVGLFTVGPVPLPGSLRARADERGVTFFGPGLPPAEAPANYAITALAARPHPLDPSRAEVLLEVASHAPAPADVEVVLTTEGRAVEVVRWSLAAGERARRLFAEVSGLDRTLEARLRVLSGPPDALPADDVGVCRVARRARLRVGVASADNAFLEAALLLDEALEVSDVSADETIAPGRFDVVIFDGTAPAEPYAGPALYLAPDPRRGGAAPLRLEAEPEVLRPRFDVFDADHPLLRWLSLRNVNVGRALHFVPAPGDEVVAGDEGVPLIVAGEREVAGTSVPFVALAFDVRQSDLPLRVAWPVLLLDAIRLLAPESASEPTSARAGVPFEEAVGEGDVRLRLAGATRSQPVAVRAGRARLSIDHAGVHRLEAGRDELLVAVGPASGRASALGPVAPVELDGRPLAAFELPPRRGARRPWEWLALAALFVLFAEALAFHRRWTV
jgi:hypothetical protein